MHSRKQTLSLGLAAVGWCAALAAQPADPEIVVFHPATADEASLELSAEAGRGASDLAATTRCDEDRRRASLAALSWEGVPSGAEAVRVDLSKLRDGFATGRFETSGPLPAALPALSVAAPEPGIHYYWRVLTLTRDGWAASAEARFEAPVCPWDPPSSPVEAIDRQTRSES